MSSEGTEPRPQVTYTEKFVKIGHVAFEICERTDRQTDTLIAILRTLRAITASEVIGGRPRYS